MRISQQLIRALFILVVGGCLGCQQEAVVIDQSLTYVDDQVAVLSSIQPSRIMKKAGFEDLRQSEIYKDLVDRVASSSTSVASILEQPEKAGIDLERPFYVCNHYEGKSVQFANAMMLVFPMKDKEQFEEMVKALDVLTIEQKTGYQQAHLDGSLLAWNEEVALMAPDAPNSQSRMRIQKAFEGDRLQSVATNRSLAKCLSEPADISIWTSLDFLAENKAIKNMVALADIPPSALKGNYSHSFVHFNEGEVLGESYYYLNSRLSRELDLFFKDASKSDFSKYLSQKNLLGTFTAALDLRGIQQVLMERPQVLAPLHPISKQLGMSTKDLLSIFDGELAFAYYLKGERPSGLLMAKVANSEQLKQLMGEAEQNGMIASKGEGLYELMLPIMGNRILEVGSQDSLNMAPSSIPQLLIKDQQLFVTDDPARMAMIQKGGYPANEQLAADQYQHLSKNIFGGQLYIDRLQNLAGNTNYADLFEDLQLTTNRQKAQFRLRLKDKRGNSLRQLIELAKENAGGTQEI